MPAEYQLLYEDEPELAQLFVTTLLVRVYFVV